MPRKLTAKAKRPGPFIQKYETILGSSAYADLTCVARCLLEEFQRVYKPGRNGKLSVSTRTAAKRLKIHKDTVTKAMRELVEHGFIVLEAVESWQDKRAREWRITFEPSGDSKPTDNWKSWRLDRNLETDSNNLQSLSLGQYVPSIRTVPSQMEGQSELSNEFRKSVIQ